MNRKTGWTIAGLGVAVLAILLITASLQNGDEQTVDVKQLVQDYSLGKIQSHSASITSHQLIVMDSGKSQVTYDLPEEEFFVSIAPYITETHSCAIHSLTGCRGEMANETFQVYIEDEAGNVVLDETMQSYANGFLDLWLPRNQTFRVEITHDGRTQTEVISTYEGDDTCITTMQLI
ncbi:hypothetical protein DUZ99_02700 [Xylanibacillus composti]|uniref:Uncharacterized protein n=1 Tax=Xylanibacillus composti TaxID=1572762 RepID=A0A8J4GZ22_9BACL|nr:CueP family metal-binding protein [Xylanibacillus composti]MDT9723906.1 hypothetical protein [Xylanibacillus composti]GIQ67784.1 hypothetical protein XYCOK13_06080 [Xylanibacillus composti]